jgi:HPt (histidine-containing phosphotransfer) domain-containing protein
MSTDLMEQMRGAFRAEALDLLIELDSALLALEAEPGDSTLVHRVFRAIHTIKGSGATAGFAHLARLAHKMEEAYDLARVGRMAVTADLIDCGHKACDVIRLIIGEEAEGAVVPGEVEATGAFTRLLPAPENPRVERAAEPKPGAGVRAAYEIVFKPNREMFYSGADPVTLLDELRELGQAHITAHADQVPSWPSLEAEHCYLWWEILLVTDRDLAAIQDVFVFVEDECHVRIRPWEDQGGAVALLGSVPVEAFELFKVECEDHLERMEGDALALEDHPESRDNLDSLFRGVHSIKGYAGLLLGHVKGSALTDSHPLHHGGRTGGPGPECAGVPPLGSKRMQLADQLDGRAGVPPAPQLSAWLRTARSASLRWFRAGAMGRRNTAGNATRGKAGTATLEQVIEDLDRLNHDTERDFLRIGGKLAEFIGAVNLISSDLTALADLISGEHGQRESQA